MINVTDILLFISLVVLTSLIIYTRSTKSTSKTHKYIYIFFCMLLFHIVCMLLQSLFAEKMDINPVYFEYFTGIVASYTPVICFMIAKSYYNEDVDLSKYRMLYVFPTLMLIGLWTNDFHNLFYVKYSTLLSESQNGILFMLNAIYSYVLIGVGLIMLLNKTYRMSGFFSKQTLLLVLGVFVTIFVNILGAFKVVSMSVYIMPILFSFLALCFALAIIKLKALNVIPVATKTIMETMTDSFIVISKDGTIADINRTCIEKFAPLMELKQNDNLYEKLEGRKTVKLADLKNIVKEANDKKTTVTKEYHFVKGDYDKYFEVDVQPIKAKSGNEFVATLLLIRDITGAKRDMEIMTKNENLVILGELAGGVAHDINTPIAAIKNGIMMLKDTVPTENEKMLLTRMDSCADKIINLVNSMRNQIRNIGSDEKSQVKISAVINDTLMIVHNEIVKKGIKINVDIKDELTVLGNSTKLGQVITNLVMNAIQAYEDKQGIIDIDLYKSDKNEAVIIVEDYAGGIPEHIRPHIFKNILTTKGVSGTGFGLYLAYSVIKGNFGGDMKFETETGKGTKFYITIPL